MVIRNRRGERIVDAEDYFVGPGTDITRMTVLEPGDLLTTIRMPCRVGRRAVLLREGPRPQRLGFRARERRVGDGRHERARSIASASSSTASPPRPSGCARVEEAVRGRPRNEETAEMAGQLAVEGARPLHHNAYKVPLMRNLVKRAIRGAETRWTS